MTPNPHPIPPQVSHTAQQKYHIIDTSFEWLEKVRYQKPYIIIQDAMYWINVVLEYFNAHI